MKRAGISWFMVAYFFMSKFSGLGFFLLILKMVINVQQNINMVHIGVFFVVYLIN